MDDKTKEPCDRVDCPWAGIESGHLEALKKMPRGAIGMLVYTYTACMAVGNLIGKALAVGIFTVLLWLLYHGGKTICNIGTIFNK